MIRSVSKRAKAKDIPCTISSEDIHVRVLECEGVCSYCGAKLDFYAGYKNRAFAPSVDRLDPKGGYTVPNISICCYRCNAIKNDATPDELRALANAIDRHLAQRRN